MSYKRLGDYIQPVNNRNRPLVTNDLRGLSMRKEFRKSTSNIVGVDLTKYKLIAKNQFACDFMSVIRVHKLPVVLHSENEPVIVSPAYTVFEVLDEEILNPEYLMMWFRRSEFDRYADFRCDSAVRGGFMWEELCDAQLPIPSIEKQQQIVAEYNTLTNRINLNNKLNQKLEATAQALYKHWFVDFEFPNTENKPYKSSGGEMIYNAELDKELPKDFINGTLDNFVKLSQGQVINAKTRHLIKDKGIPLLRITELVKFSDGKIFIDKSVNPKNIAIKEDLIYTRTGNTCGLVFKNREGVVYNNCFKVIPINKNISRDYIYWYLKQKSTFNIMVSLASSSAQPDLTHKAFFSVDTFIPDVKTQKLFSDLVSVIDAKMHLCQLQIKKIEEFQIVLLSKMIKVEAKPQAV